VSTITDYSSTLIKIVVDENNIYFIDKDGASVAGTGGKLVLTSSSGKQFSFEITNMKSPSKNSLEEVVVAVQVIIDNV
jgi:hypothetical protein